MPLGDATEQVVREIAADLAEAWVERAGTAAGFVVWEDDGDVRSFTEEAQDRFDEATNRIEPALRQYVHDAARDAAAALVMLGEALAGIAESAAVEAAATRLARARG